MNVFWVAVGFGLSDAFCKLPPQLNLVVRWKRRVGMVKLWKIFAGLGIPGLALGTFYMLFKKYDWKFPAVPKSWVGPIFVLFLLAVWSTVLASLYLWSPDRKDGDTQGSSKQELVKVLDARAKRITDQIDSDVQSIDKAVFDATKEMSPVEDESVAGIYEKIMKESSDIINELRQFKVTFQDLHKKHINAIQNDQRVLAREFSNQIIVLLREEYPRITAKNVGISLPNDPFNYQGGDRDVLVDTRRTTGFYKQLDKIYTNGDSSETVPPNKAINSTR